MASLVVATVATAAAAAASSAIGGIMGAIAGAAIMVGISAIGHAIFGAKAPNVSSATRQPQDIQRTIQSSTEPRKIVYGRAKVGGPPVLAYSTGYKHQYLHLVEALCEGPVAAIESVWFNDTLSTDPRWQEAGGGHRTITHTGSYNQAADGYLVSEVPGWTTEHMMRGIAYVYTRLHYQPFDPDGDPDQPMGSDVWCNGVPSISAVVKGRLVYDPRDATQGMNDPNTWKWSENPALCILDYIRAGSPDINWPLNSAGKHTPPFRGLEAPNEEIDWNNWAAAANICDETIVYADGTGKRFTLNGAIFLDAQPSEIMEQMLTSCVGNIVYAQGLWRLFPGAMGTSDFSLTEDDLRDSIKVMPQKSKRELFNTITGTYVNASGGYIESEFPTLTDVGPVNGGQSYEEMDGGRVEKGISLLFTNDHRLAQRIAKLALRKQRIAKQVIFPAKMTALPISAQSVVSLSIGVFGWENKLFRVADWSLTDFGVDLTLQEESAQIYAYTSAEEKASVSTPVVVPDPWFVEPPLNLIFNVGQFALTGTAELVWDVSPDAFVAGYRVQYKETSETKYTTLIDRIRATKYSITNLGVGSYTFRIQAINTIGATSSWVSINGEIEVPLIMERVSGLELWEGMGLGNAVVFTGNDAKFVWRSASKTYSYEFGEEPFGADSGAPDTYFKDYEVRIIDPDSGIIIRVEHPTTNYWEYPFEKNLEDGLRRSFKIEVYQRGNQNQLSAQPATMTVSNPAPQELTGLKVDPGFGTIYIQFISPTDNDFKGILVWLSDTPGFTPSAENLVFDGIGNAVSVSGLEQGQNYYIRLAGYDGFGKTDLNMSSEFTVETLKSDVDKEYVDAQDAFFSAQAESAAKTYADAAAKTATDWQYTGTIDFDGGNIHADTLTAVAIGANQIITEIANIKNGVIVSAHIGDAQIGNAHIVDGTIDNVKIADATITDAKINDLDGSKIHADSVITIGDVDGSNYCMLTDGEVKTFRYLEGDSRQTKDLKQWEIGWCDNADATDPNSPWTELTGYYITPPKLFLSPKSLQTFKNLATMNDQSVNMDAPLIELIPGHTNKYRFKANARLILGTGTTSVSVNQQTTNVSVSDTYKNTTETTPINVTAIVVTADVTTTHGTGTQGLWYIRTFRWRIYVDNVAQEWSEWYTIRNTISNRVSTSKSGLSVGSHTFQVETEVADAGGTFNTGTVTEYTTETEIAPQTYFLNGYNDSSDYTTTYTKTFSFTVPSGSLSEWTLDSIKLTTTFNLYVNNIQGSQISLGSVSIKIDGTSIRYEDSVPWDNPISLDFNVTNKTLSAGSHNVTLSYYCGSYQCHLETTFQMKQGTYVYSYSRLKPGTTAVENKTVTVSYDYTTDSVNTLAEGTVNYLALGE
jgi:hypothetical protein